MLVKIRSSFSKFENVTVQDSLKKQNIYSLFFFNYFSEHRFFFLPFDNYIYF